MNDNVAKAYNFFKVKPGHLKTKTDEIAQRLGITYDDVAKGRKIYRDDENDTETITNANDGVEQQIEEAGVAKSYEEFLEKHDINREDVTNVWFKEKASGTYFSVETRKYRDDEPDFDPVEAFRDAIKEYSPPDYSSSITAAHTHKDRIGIISLFDAHLDKICCLAETDQERTIEDNIADFEHSFNELLESIAVKQPEQILFPIGNDFFHTNDSTLTTKRGTPMWDRIHVTDMEAFRIGLNLIRKCIDKARHVANVKVIPVRGNHDEDRVRYLLECLLVAYENQEDVDLVDTRKSRIYHRYGSWLFGFAHGDKAKKVKDFPSLMSTDKDSRKHWAEITQGIYFLGHIHNEKRYELMKNHDFRGCKVNFLRAVSGQDEWHWSSGYTGIPRTAYGFVYDKDGTRDYEFKVNI